MKVLLLSRYDRLSASSRQRFLQYLPLMEQQNIHTDVSPLFSDEYLLALYSGKSYWRLIFSGYWTRIKTLFKVRSYDLIWIQIEIFPYIPAFVERLLRFIGVVYIVDYDDAILGLYKRLGSNRIELEDLILEIQRVQENIVVNTDELERINEIISHIEMLKRKYGGSIESVIEYKEKIIQSEKDSGNCKDDIKKLEIKLEDISKHLNNYAEKLSQNRNKTAARLESIIKRNLENLNMPDIQFEINLSTDPDNIQETGMDSCEFFISTNIGEELRPVVKIASGGEISRIMLAIKMALQSKDIVDTLIFDEIDLGISGATAERVGETFEKLSESHQILCITHLSQIAGKGNTHYKVSKSIKENRIVVNVNKLSKTDRIGEIATLISGQKITESSRKQAEELLHFNG